MEEKELVSSSETIGVPQIKQILEVGRTMNMMLTHDEFIAIMVIYNSAVERLLKENGEQI